MSVSPCHAHGWGCLFVLLPVPELMFTESTNYTINPRIKVRTAYTLVCEQSQQATCFLQWQFKFPEHRILPLLLLRKLLVASCFDQFI